VIVKPRQLGGPDSPGEFAPWKKNTICPLAEAPRLEVVQGPVHSLDTPIDKNLNCNFRTFNVPVGIIIVTTETSILIHNYAT
jgi:hypothetical protein